MGRLRRRNRLLERPAAAAILPKAARAMARIAQHKCRKTRIPASRKSPLTAVEIVCIGSSEMDY